MIDRDGGNVLGFWMTVVNGTMVVFPFKIDVEWEVIVVNGNGGIGGIVKCLEARVKHSAGMKTERENKKTMKEKS